MPVVRVTFNGVTTERELEATKVWFGGRKLSAKTTEGFTYFRVPKLEYSPLLRVELQPDNTLKMALIRRRVGTLFLNTDGRRSTELKFEKPIETPTNSARMFVVSKENEDLQFDVELVPDAASPELSPGVSPAADEAHAPSSPPAPRSQDPPTPPGRRARTPEPEPALEATPAAKRPPHACEELVNINVAVPVTRLAEVYEFLAHVSGGA